MTLRKNWPDIAGGIFLLLLALGALAWWRAPRLLPAADQAELLPTADILIPFSAPVDSESVRTHLIFPPDMPFTMLWDDAHTLRLRPQHAWPAGSRLQVGIGPGARAAAWPHLPVLGTTTWEVRISAPSLLYLWPTDNEPANIYRLQPASGEIQALTDDPQGVTGYHASADGLHIYFANLQGDLYVLDRLTGESPLLLDCGRDVCANPQVNPAGTRLAFERTPTDRPPQQAYSQVWILPLDEGEPFPLETHYSRLPQWSASGWLSVYLPADGVYHAYPPQGGQPLIWQNQTGEPGTWLPDSRTFIAPEIFSLPNGYITENNVFLDMPASHLLAYAVQTGAAEDWSEDLPVEDIFPAISPDGRYLAFARKYLDVKRWRLGRQLWLRDLHAGTNIMLTDAPEYTHTAFAWSPDSAYLVYVRSSQADFSQPPEIWMVNATTGSAPLRLVIGGAAPQWIP
ncbi:MAG: hypothetical protein Fur0018_14360 [Anaerolineales bacterium]